MAPRIKLTQQINRPRAEELAGEIALLSLEKTTQITSMDRAITAVRERYEISLQTIDKVILEKTSLLETWAAANPDEFPKNRKSIDLVHAVVGYRTGMPKLKTLLRWTWAKVLEALQTSGESGYIRTKEDVDKEKILSDFAQNQLTAADLKVHGMLVVQDETFFVEPKLQEIDNRSVKEAA